MQGKWFGGFTSEGRSGVLQSDTPRKAGGLMGWTASKAVGYWFKASR